eukprot:gb/GECG01013920.1/.p1 GENE.gb/GECG01013920.1/~~gb/GECG01013920.1/.p1  ORF type:complete len:321 (+),score=35.63 gb/GECG01013920.1/:1-963(+)
MFSAQGVPKEVGGNGFTASKQAPHGLDSIRIQMGNRTPVRSLAGLAGKSPPREGAPSSVLPSSTREFNLVGMKPISHRPVGTPNQAIPVNPNYAIPNTVLGKRNFREIPYADPPVDSSSISVDSPDVNPVDYYSTEEAASQLLNLNKSKNPPAYSTGGAQRSGSGNTSTSSQGGHLRIRRKSNEIERDYNCCFCDKRYGSVSALTLHLRHKHPHLVKEMYALGSIQDLLPIHARSVAAFVNDALTVKHVRPERSAEEAIRRSAPDKCTKLSSRRTNEQAKSSRLEAKPSHGYTRNTSTGVQNMGNGVMYSMAPMAALRPY